MSKEQASYEDTALLKTNDEFLEWVLPEVKSTRIKMIEIMPQLEQKTLAGMERWASRTGAGEKQDCFRTEEEVGLKSPMNFKTHLSLAGL